MAHPERLPFALDLVLQLAREPMDIAAIGQFLNRGPRTVRRVLAALRKRGIPLDERVLPGRAHRKTYTVRLDQLDQDRLRLGSLDMVALRYVVARARPRPGEPFHEEVRALEEKLKAAFVWPHTGLYQELADVIVAPATVPTESEPTASVAEDLMNCARLHKVCDVRYVGNDGEERAYPIHPLLIYERGGRHYLAAYSPERQGVRAYVLSRFRQVDPRKERFDPPKDWDPDAWTAGSFGVMHDRVWSIRVRFDPMLADYVRERTWHASQQIRALDDGGVELTMEAEGRSEIVAWVLRFGELAELVEPVELRHEIASRLNAAAKLYDAPPSRRRRSLAPAP